MSTALIDDLVRKLNAGEIRGDSAYKLRNEEAQNRVRIKRIPRLAYELKKNAKLLIPLELALPFNPMTGQADEKFNEGNKFRPLLSPTSAALAVKKMAEQNPVLKETLMLRSGVKEWDTSDTPDLTSVDREVFRLYRFPRIMTMKVISIKDQRITGQEFGVEYVVNVDRNEFGQVEGDWPMFLQANKFFRDRNFEEAEHIKDLEKKAKAGEDWKSQSKSKLKDLQSADLAGIPEKEFKELLGKVYGQTIVSEDYPSNYLVLYEVPLNTNMEVQDLDQFKTLAPEELDKMMRIAKLTKELSGGLDGYRGGKYTKKFDKHYDFWELDMSCPVEITSDQPKRDIPKGTRYESPVNALYEEQDSPVSWTKENYASFVNLIRNKQDDSENLEERFLFSAYVKKYDQSIENRLLEAIAIDDPIDGSDPFITEQVIKQNANFISKVFGADGDMLVSSVEAGISDTEKGVLDETKAAADARGVNLAEMMGADGEAAEEDAVAEAAETAGVAGTTGDNQTPKADTISIDD